MRRLYRSRYRKRVSFIATNHSHRFDIFVSYENCLVFHCFALLVLSFLSFIMRMTLCHNEYVIVLSIWSFIHLYSKTFGFRSLEVGFCKGMDFCYVYLTRLTMVPSYSVLTVGCSPGFIILDIATITIFGYLCCMQYKGTDDCSTKDA